MNREQSYKFIDLNVGDDDDIFDILRYANDTMPRSEFVEFLTHATSILIEADLSDPDDNTLRPRSHVRARK